MTGDQSKKGGQAARAVCQANLADSANFGCMFLPLLTINGKPNYCVKRTARRIGHVSILPVATKVDGPPEKWSLFAQ